MPGIAGLSQKGYVIQPPAAAGAVIAGGAGHGGLAAAILIVQLAVSGGRRRKPDITEAVPCDLTTGSVEISGVKIHPPSADGTIFHDVIVRGSHGNADGASKSAAINIIAAKGNRNRSSITAFGNEGHIGQLRRARAVIAGRRGHPGAAGAAGIVVVQRPLTGGGQLEADAAQAGAVAAQAGLIKVRSLKLHQAFPAPVE